jgi:hypothetical protein
MDPQGVGVPDSLYNLGISAVIDSYQCFKNEIRILPDNLMFDLYYKVRILVLVIEAGNQNIVQELDVQVEVRSYIAHSCLHLILVVTKY